MIICCPTLAECSQTSAKLGSMSSEVWRHSAYFGQIWPRHLAGTTRIGRSQPNTIRSDLLPDSLEFDRGLDSPGIDQIPTGLEGQLWSTHSAELGQLGVDFGRCCGPTPTTFGPTWPSVDRSWPDLDRMSRCLAALGPSLGHPGRPSNTTPSSGRSQPKSWALNAGVVAKSGAGVTASAQPSVTDRSSVWTSGRFPATPRRAPSAL